MNRSRHLELNLRNLAPLAAHLDLIPLDQLPVGSQLISQLCRGFRWVQQLQDCQCGLQRAPAPITRIAGPASR